MKKVIISVDNNEAAVVSAADSIELRANGDAAKREERASKRHLKKLVEPMAFFATKEDAKIVNERDRLQQKYKKELQLPVSPILVPEAPSDSAPAKANIE